ncbi:MAG: hypothetical protein L3K06_01520 [Thermoplasmata archaeon]|nr:hypothetical protein [Thermoplasmata archaeon]MCI4354028.1 hypothetical protein [Thermoplasmata archaeon]
MSVDGGATADGPGRRRESWSLKNLVEDIAGRPISELQDPTRPVHPYLQVKMAYAAPAHRPEPSAPTAAGARGAASAELAAPDPVDRVYPPLVGATGRTLHGPDHEHHAETLNGIATSPEEPIPGRPNHAPGPSQRPERIYLHYLLLHMDRLTDHALRYLQHAVDEEVRHREGPAASPPPPGARNP